MIAIGAFERPCLGQVRNFILEMFVCQVEDHRLFGNLQVNLRLTYWKHLLSDLFFADETGLHHHLLPPDSSAAARLAGAGPGRGWASRQLLPRPPQRRTVELAHVPVRHTVVDCEVVPHLGLVAASLGRTFEWRYLNITTKKCL